MRTTKVKPTDPLTSATFNGKNSVVWLKADDIRIDPDRQRAVRPTWVRYLAENFIEDELGIVYVSHRPTGFYAIDGQHRIMACRLRQEGDRLLECKVYEGLSKPDEARLFRRLNKRLNVRLFDDFRVSLAELVPESIHINQMVETVGLRVSEQSTDGNLTAIKACQEIYRGAPFRAKEPTPWALMRTLRTVTEAWQLSRDAVSGEMIRGVGAVHLRYGDAIDLEALARKLAKFPGGPLGIVARAKIKREMSKGTVWRAIAEVIVDIYNKGLRKDQLPDFARR